MNLFSHIVIAMLLAASSFIIPRATFASDWRQFRGPNGSGYSSDATIPQQPKIHWSADLPGRGLSSPIVVGDRVFVSCASGPRQERLHVICFDFGNGGKIWERQMKATGRTMSHNKTCVASSSPCSDGQRLFVQWSCND